MRNLIRGALVASAAGAIAVGVAGTAGAVSGGPAARFPGRSGVVFVQTDNTAGNQIVAYERAPNGSLTWSSTVNTGGRGGTLDGSVVDHLASEGALAIDQPENLLFAVNAGSNSVSVFSVSGDHLTLDQVVSSGGTFPVSVTVHGHFAYVVNAEDGGSVQGYFVAGPRLVPLPDTTRTLGLTRKTTTTPTQFTHTPGSIAVSPNGSQLIVTTKANGDDIDVFGIGPSGALSPRPTANPEGTTVPFGISFDRAGHLVIAESSSTDPALATFNVAPNGKVTAIDTVGTGQVATCWVAGAQGFFFTSNAGSGSESGFTESPNGQLRLIGNTKTDAGTVDAAATPDGQWLYVQTGASGIVDEFHVNSDGTLTQVGSVTVPNAVGAEGIVAL